MTADCADNSRECLVEAELAQLRLADDWLAGDVEAALRSLTIVVPPKPANNV